MAFYKQARRKDDDIAIVNGAFNVHLNAKTAIVESAKFAFGGMGPTVIVPSSTLKVSCQ